MFWRMLFLALVVGQSNQCSREYVEVELSRIKDENCSSINEITQQPPLKIKCLKGNCTFWCEKFALCLHQSDKWQKECARKFKKLFRGHRRTKMKVHAEGNQSSLLIEVKFCEWKSRYKVYTIKSFDSVSEGNGDLQEGENLHQEELLSSLKSVAEYYSDEIRNKSEDKKEKIEEMFFELTTLETSVLETAQFKLNHSTSEFTMSSIYADVLVRKTFYQNESRHFRLEEPNGENFLNIPPGNLDNGSVVLGMIYKDLHQLFITNQTENSTLNNSREVTSIIMAATITPPPKKLQENITLKFKNIKNSNNKKKCMFWNMLDDSSIGWSGEGCYVKSTDAYQTECTCNHLTHFAVLLDTSSGTETADISANDEKNLEILTYVGLTLSVIGISLTIISYVTLTDMRRPLSQIRVSLVASLGAGQIMFLAGIGATGNKGGCVTVAALMQYFLMAAFCWMLVEGIYLYLFIVKVYNVGNKLRMCHGLSWGLPALIVAISLSIAAGKDGIESFLANKYCWMSSANGLIWILIVFVVLIEFFNILILGRVIKEMMTMQQEKDKRSEQIRLGVKACIVMIPLLGISWLFGLLAPLHKAFAYIFTILNSSQGFVIFLLHCVRNSEVRARLRRRIQAIFPAMDVGTSTKRTSVMPSEVNEDSTAIAAPRKIKVHPLSDGEKTKRVSNKTSM